VLVLLMAEICDMWHDVCAKFHNYQFRNSRHIKVIASTILEAAMLVLLIGEIYEVCR
jgi:hypothetical protein